MAKPYQQDVILDADGKPLFNAMDILERRIAGIGKTIEKIQSDSFKTVNNLNKTIDANVKALQKAQSQMNTLANTGATDRRAQRTLAGRQAGADAGRFGTNTTRVGYEFELEKRLDQLQRARTERERRAALEAVQTAQARLRAIQEIERAEGRAASNQQRLGTADVVSTHRARLALARQYADQQIRTLGTENAVTAAKARQLQAEQKLAGANSVNREELRRQLELENARVRATERLAAAQARAARTASGGAGGGGGTAGGGGNGPPIPVPGGGRSNSRLSNILSPGYAAAAFARTSVYGAAAAAAYGVFNTVSDSVGQIVQMDDELAKLQAIAGATDQQMLKLKDSIYEVGRSSRFSVVELVKVAQVLAQAGVSAADMTKVLSSVTTLATSSGSTPDEAVQLLTSALGAFQLQGNEAARVADLMTAALNRTKLTVQQAGQAIQYVGATAYEQNISLEQMLATIGAIAQAGVRSGSTIGTGFRQFLVDLQEPSKKLDAQLKALGLTAADVDVSVRGLPAVLETLRDAGFGAAQAYEGMETRAAAFYLTAKNNVDIMDRLQLAFTQQGSAAVANDRAMSSLSAQWQRFKNGLAELFSGPAGEVVDHIQAIITKINSLIESINEYNKHPGPKRDQLSFLGNVAAGATAGGIGGAIFGGVGAVPGAIVGGAAGGINAAVIKYTRDSKDAAIATVDLTTKIADQNDKIDQQRNRIGELDKELLRLVTQKESLIKNETRSSAETATLTSKFEGLALNLTKTGSTYDDLVDAMKRYRNQQILLLNTDLLSQQAQLTLDTANARTRSGIRAKALMEDPAFYAKVQNPAIMQALSDTKNMAPGSRGFNTAQTILVDAINHFATSQPDVAKKLNEVVQEVGKVAYNTAVLGSIKLETEHNAAATTDFGKNITDKMRDVESLIERMSSQENGTNEKKSLTGQANSILNALERNINGRLTPGVAGPNATFLKEALQTVQSLHKQVSAMNLATADELKDAKAAERELEKGPKLTQAQLDSIAKAFLGPGFVQGSGVRSAAEQNHLHAIGATPATAAGSSHSNGGLARDWRLGPNMTPAQAASLAEGLRQHFKNMGVDVYVKFETGQGRNQGTGPHIHTSAKKGTRFKGSAGGSDAAALDQFQDSMDAAQLGLDKRELSTAFKEMADATSQAALDAAIIRSREALKKIQTDLRNKAQNDLAKGGIGPGMPEYKARMAQLADEEDQLADEYQRNLVDKILKSAKETVKAATEAFEAALKPSQNALNIAQGVVTGLGFESNRGNVPDYTMALAQQQAARASEAAERAKLTALPGLIDQTQGVLNGLVTSRDSGTLDQNALAQVNLQILELTNNLEGLKNTRDGLAAAFGAEGLIPKTLGEGLAQAAAAYRELHNLGQTFTQQVNGELTGAIEGLHQGFTDLFATVLENAGNAGQAALQFGRMIVQMVTQIVAKMLATQVISMILSLFGAVAGSVGGGKLAGVPVPEGVDFSGGWFNGGPIGYAKGGRVRQGNSMRDSVLAKVSKGEWVVNRRAVDSVGHDFMTDLNSRGAEALKGTQAGPSIELKQTHETNVYVVPPQSKPTLGPNDVLATWQDDVVSGGQSKRLIEHVVRETSR